MVVVMVCVWRTDLPRLYSSVHTCMHNAHTDSVEADTQHHMHKQCRGGLRSIALPVVEHANSRWLEPWGITRHAPHPPLIGFVERSEQHPRAVRG